MNGRMHNGILVVYDLDNSWPRPYKMLIMDLHIPIEIGPSYNRFIYLNLKLANVLLTFENENHSAPIIEVADFHNEKGGDVRAPSSGARMEAFMPPKNRRQGVQSP
jgi:hypothetical protein